ncbi:cytosolic phospholipase A2-like [Liolophura sinensis]|uniref:cytosolic phospholipase A2-like n=1 Tax=Liolophura sinensis TaxID=3198878 RepID=UPI00315970C5
MQHCHEFVVDHRPCLILYVNVLRGRKITKGWGDMVDTPDPYIELKMRKTPDAKRRTATKTNEINPVWNENFRYLLDPKEKNILHINLKDDNYTMDGTIGSEQININSLERNKWIKKTVTFNKVSEIDMELKTEIDTQPNLRYSVDLCEEEMNYLKARKLKTMTGMGRLLGGRGPKTIEEVPTVAVMGSGGGFRAMVAYSGVFKALQETGVLDCVTYTCGLSGSCWLLSTLYSHPKWPKLSLKEFQEELKKNIDASLINLMGMQQVSRYISAMMEKWNNGQPISFTDFFGHLVGETLIKDRKDCTLTDQQIKLVDGNIPMPLYTCVHVKKNVSARAFQEWIEFSPFEIGMAKFGSFMKSEYFGSKFFMGKLAKKYDEPPLHFLQGIWGSAFCIMFNRLFDDNRNMDPVEMVRREMKKKIKEESVLSDGSEDEDDDDDDDFDNHDNSHHDHCEELTDTPTAAKSRKTKEEDEQQGVEKTVADKGFWMNWFKSLVDSKRFQLLSTRTGRAGVIHNFLRGISLLPKGEEPKTPEETDSDDSDEGIRVYSTHVKKQFVVDAGLTFNSPYPLVLRQARGIDLILSFDFSGRPSDDSEPFKEIKLAEKWAKHNGLRFPPIDTSVFEKEGMKELYIFRDPNDPNCPIILHFVLVNLDFRKYKKPGVPRETTEEKEFADFAVFDDPEAPYSTFNFTYTHKAFDRLSQLMEFNTLNHLKEIKEAIAEAVQKKRK